MQIKVSFLVHNTDGLACNFDDLVYNDASTMRREVITYCANHSPDIRILMVVLTINDSATVTYDYEGQVIEVSVESDTRSITLYRGRCSSIYDALVAIEEHITGFDE